MKKIIVFLVMLAMTCTISTYAQYDMGDAELNTSLNTIISKAKVQFSEFKSYITLTYNVHRDKYAFWESELGMNAGDIYLTVEVAKVSQKSIDDVATSFKRNKKQGWGSIAKEFGVGPGTDAFEVLKGHAYKKAYGKPRPVAKPAIKKPATKPAKTTKPKPKPKTTPKPKKE